MAEKCWSNYEIMQSQMAVAFLNYDQEKMIGKFALENDERFLYMEFVGRHYRIDRKNGVVMWQASEDWNMAGYNEAMTIYDVLCYAKQDCKAAGAMVNLENLSAIKGGSLRKTGSFFKNSGEFFTGKAEKLISACTLLGGKSDGVGDVGYTLQLFPFLPVAIHFWDADEDFSASLQILVDANILDFMHYETVMFAIGHLLGRLRALVLEQEESYKR